MPMLINTAVKAESREATITDEYALHVLDVDDDGILYYKKVYMSGEESISINSGEGFAYNGIEDLEENLDGSEVNVNASLKGYTESGRQQYETDRGDRAFDQMRMDKNKLIYFEGGSNERNKVCLERNVPTFSNLKYEVIFGENQKHSFSKLI